MIKQLFILLLFICSLQSHSQKLVYKSNGNILNSENQQISPDQVRELLKNNQQLLADYNAGRTKKTVGNILLYGGIAIVIGKFAYNNFADSSETSQNQNYNNNYNFQYTTTYKEKSSALYFVGLASIVASVPVKMGFSKKIKNVVSEYNNSLKLGSNDFKIQKTEFITNQNGAGIRLTFN